MAVFQIQNFKVERFLSVFSNQTDELVTEHPLSSFNLTRFKQHFRVPEEDEDFEMVMEYDVQPKDVEFLSGYLNENVDYDFRKYAYFLSCQRVDEPEENIRPSKRNLTTACTRRPFTESLINLEYGRG